MSSPNVVEKEPLIQKAEGNIICIFYEDYSVEGGERVQGSGLANCALRNIVVLHLGTY